MNQTAQEAFYKEYPYFESEKDRIILVTTETYDELQFGRKIKYGDLEISITILNEFLTNDFAFEYILRSANGKIKEVMLAEEYYGDAKRTINLSAVNFVRFIDVALENGLIRLDEKAQERLDMIRSKVSYELFKSSTGSEYTIEMDGKTYSISPSVLFKILEMSDEELKSLCNNEEITQIYGIPKNYAIYAAMKFFDSGCMNDYLFSEAAIRRLYDLKTQKFIDVESINKHVTIEDRNQDKFQVNENLKSAIFEGMPTNLSKVEQAIFIYIRMCKILTYDEEFYALDQKVPNDHKHRSLSYVKEITPENNQVVCYEFNAIYAKLLEGIGITFTIDYKDLDDQTYGLTHSNLEWRYHRYLVKADSTETFLGNDMMQAKLNQPLKGLECINMNKDTRIDFQRLLSRVYRMVALLENKDAKNIEKQETLSDLLKEYSKCTRNIRNVSLEEKIEIFFSKVNHGNLKGIDFLAYLLQLSKVIFTEEERKENINIVIIRKNKNYGKDEVKPVAVMVVNTESINNNPEENEYFVFDGERRLDSIDLIDLQDEFDEELLSYINPKKDPEISGVEKRGIK